jgi:hypothetical protein
MKMIYSFAQNNLEFYSYLKRTNIDITHFFFSKKENIDNVSTKKKIEIKTQISNLVCTTHFWKKN